MSIPVHAGWSTTSAHAHATAIHALNVGGAAIDVADVLLASLPVGNTLAAAIVEGPKGPVARGCVPRVFVPRNPNTFRLLVDYYNDGRRLPEGLSRATVSLLRKEARHFALDDLYTECKVLYPLRCRAWAAKALGNAPARAAALQVLAAALRRHGRVAEAERKQLRAARLLNELARAPSAAAMARRDGVPTATSPRLGSVRASNPLGPRPAPRRQPAQRGEHVVSPQHVPRRLAGQLGAGAGFAYAELDVHARFGDPPASAEVDVFSQAAPGTASSAAASARADGDSALAHLAGCAAQSIPGIGAQAASAPASAPTAPGQPVAEAYTFPASWPPPSFAHAPRQREGGFFAGAVRQTFPLARAATREADAHLGERGSVGVTGLAPPSGTAGSKSFETLSYVSGSTPEQGQRPPPPWTPPNPPPAAAGGGPAVVREPHPQPGTTLYKRAAAPGAPAAAFARQDVVWAPAPTTPLVSPRAAPQSPFAQAFGGGFAPWSRSLQTPQSPATYARVSAWSTSVAACAAPPDDGAVAAKVEPAPSYGYAPCYLFSPPSPGPAHPGP